MNYQHRYLRGINLFIVGLLVCILALGSCVRIIKIKDGETAFERKRYAQAIPLLEKEYKNSSVQHSRALSAYYLAESHRRLSELDAAIVWYERAIELNYGLEAVAQYAFTLRQIGDYAKAKKLLQYLTTQVPRDVRVNKELRSIDLLIKWDEMEKYRGVSIQNMELNTQAAEFYPRRISENKLVFISDRASSTGDKPYQWTGRSFMDLYVYNLRFHSVERFNKIPATEYNEGMIARDAARQTIIFTRCGIDGDGEEFKDQYCQLYQLKNPNTFYQELAPMPFTIDKMNYMHPVLNDAGDFLIFSAFLEGGEGNYDLWYSRKLRGKWQTPQLLSSRINTRGDEMFPNLVGDTLYFSSNFLTGYGGLDIFKTYIMEDGTWAPPQNLKSPINSGYDDMGFVPDYAYAQAHGLDFAGYFSSNRPGGKGSDDIYFFSQKKLSPPDSLVPEEKEDLARRLRLNIQVKKKRFIVENKPISGLDTLLNLTNTYIRYTHGNTSDTLRVNEVAEVEIPIDTTEEYRFKVMADNYLSKTFTLDPTGKLLPQREVTTLAKTVVLDSIIHNVEIVLKNIYYDYDKWNIRADAEPTLDTLAILLKANPQLKIALNSNTDCRGSEAYNKELSQKRAESVVQYLIGQGIAADRLKARGYGESRPAVDCQCNDCTEEEHQKNRRTSFTILE